MKRPNKFIIFAEAHLYLINIGTLSLPSKAIFECIAADYPWNVEQ